MYSHLVDKSSIYMCTQTNFALPDLELTDLGPVWIHLPWTKL